MKNQTTTAPAEDSLIILPHQQPAFDRLVEVATACFYTSRNSMPGFALRTNTLLIGSSGSGKSFLSRALAKHLGAPMLSLSVADWILVGCSERGAVTTWPSIVRFLQQYRRREGLIIFLDEIQHICGHSGWERFLRVELFSLLDLRVPRGLSAKAEGESGERSFGEEAILEVEEVLKNRTLIIAAGAFQEIWEKRPESPIGFHSRNLKPEMPSLRTLTETLPTELTNRFRSDLLILPPLTHSDYKTMLYSSAETIPSYLRNTFLHLGHERLPEVTRLRLGTRFLEELLLDTILHERAALRSRRRYPQQLEFSFGDLDVVDWIP